MKSLVVGEDNKNYGEICLTDKRNISRLSAAGSKKTPLCYSKVKVFGNRAHLQKANPGMEYIHNTQAFELYKDLTFELSRYHIRAAKNRNRCVTMTTIFCLIVVTRAMVG